MCTKLFIRRKYLLTDLNLKNIINKGIVQLIFFNPSVLKKCSEKKIKFKTIVFNYKCLNQKVVCLPDVFLLIW